jgi:hypothetical protein
MIASFLLEDESGEFSFGTTVKSRFKREINELAQEGWVVNSPT